MARLIVVLLLITASCFSLPTIGVATEASPQNRSIILESLPSYTPSPPAPVARPPLQPARLSLRLVPNSDVLRIGEPFEICFASSRNGYVSVWYIDARGTVQRLYPNRFTRAVARVGAGSENCIGGGTDRFRLIQAGPAGVNDIILLWTQDAVQQPGETQFRSANMSGDYLTLANPDPNSLDAVELFVNGMRSVLVQGTVPVGHWQTRHLRVFSQ
jgi:Domain of unknown function (DUF4384)